MTAIKICGINDPAAFDAAVEASADWIGFVFFPRSPRYIVPAVAADLSKRNRGGPLRVGLFVEPDLATLAATLDTVKLDALQIYGGSGLVDQIKSRFGLPVWRALGIAAAKDLPKSSLGADRLVLEAKPPATSDRPGGNAATFDWSLLNGWVAPAPWMLAGGLTPANVASAIAATAAPAVDVSSGVESSKGVKDPALIRAFIAAVRSASAAESGRP